MSTSDAGERGRAEPIDVDFEPAERSYGHGSGGIGLGSAFVLAVLAAGTGAAGGALAPRVPEINALLNKALPESAQSASGAAVTADAAALDTRLDHVEAVLNTPFAEAASAGGGDGANVAARVFALQSGLQDVQGRLNRMPSTEQVAALVTEVQRLQQELPAVAAQSRTAAEAARAAFAVAAAAEASRSSGPFEQSYASLQALLPQDPNVLALAPLARTGAPTRAELRDSFADIDNDIIRVARQAQAGAGFWGRIQSALAQWIIVRRAGEGDTPAGVVERAETRLKADDLAGAIQELNRLSGPPAQVAAPWLANAQRRLEIDQRLAAVRTELSRRS
jgi:hypothetical protein